MRLSLQLFLLSWDSANYCVWSQILEMHIASRMKKGYITGRKIAPVEGDLNYDEWEAEDALVNSWLINSMTSQLMSHLCDVDWLRRFWMQSRGAILMSPTVLEYMN